MISDNLNRDYFGSVTKDDVPLCEPEGIMNFLKNIILAIQNNLSSYIKQCNANENYITQEIIIRANDGSPFSFIRDNITPASSYTEDIGVYGRCRQVGDVPVFLIEAKRLNSTLPTKREKEYIIGKIGGIERFKRCKHAQSHNIAGMIGYMQSDSFEKWEIKINSYIDEEIKNPTYSDLTWSKEDKLNLKNQSELFARYESLHSRICKQDKIKLLHLWINLT
ncbi:MAG: hypothetical protein LBL65_07140 [Campylobacteraceae bacterium]|jgi:hypothetical protein|nr:hypothetical protein [Campylobacteraceae bacterium]